MTRTRGGATWPHEGSFALLVTPFDEAGRIEPRSYAALVEHHAAAGVQGIFAVCGTSEMADLAPDERRWLAREAVARAGGLPVVATANLEADAGAQVEEVRRMAATGLGGVVLVPPRRHDGQVGPLVAYFARLAEASPVPVLLYEWPGSRPSEIPAAAYGRLVAEAGVAGIKDTTCTVGGIAAKVHAAPGTVVYQANTPLLLAAFAEGARGTMTIASAARPDLLGGLWTAHREGRAGDAAALAREIVFLDAVVGARHPAAAKWLLQRAGIIRTIRTRVGDGAALTDPQVASLRAWMDGAPADGAV